MTNRVYIFDTTLRDGEQSPGCSMTVPEKVRMAAKLVDLGVDILEAGFPIASVTRTTSGAGSVCPAVSLCASPLTLAMTAAGPAVAVAWKVTGATPATVAV